MPTLIEEMIRLYGSNPSKWNWIYISQFQGLSKDFIREFKDKVCWSSISCNQKLSESFIEEFKDKIDMKWLVKHNKSCPPDIRIKYMIDNNIIKKQDPNTHIIEYGTKQVIKQCNDNNNALQLLKDLIKD